MIVARPHLRVEFLAKEDEGVLAHEPIDWTFAVWDMAGVRMCYVVLYMTDTLGWHGNNMRKAQSLGVSSRSWSWRTGT